MNKWVEESIKRASMHGYLDKLHEVYPMENSGFREISLDAQKRIRTALRKKDGAALITVLLKELKLFPIKDSYVAYLRKGKSTAITNNPDTIKRLSDRLIKMGFEEILSASTQPKETNRQIGPLFRKWLHSQKEFKVLDKTAFLAHSKGIAVLAGSDKVLKDFAKAHLAIRLKKGVDLVMKKNQVYVIGEAKFLTDFGGHQNAQFADPFGLISSRAGKVIRIAILDGVVWLPTKNKMHVEIKKGNKLAMSALLLKKYLKTI